GERGVDAAREGPRRGRGEPAQLLEAPVPGALAAREAACVLGDALEGLVAVEQTVGQLEHRAIPQGLAGGRAEPGPGADGARLLDPAGVEHGPRPRGDAPIELAALE